MTSGRLVRCGVGADDTLDVFSCHGFGGLVGMILTSCFADKNVNSFGACT
jgi:ammonia channel protein AmtB